MPHLNYSLDYCVEAFIVFENKVLLRIHDKYDMWLSVGGHIELGEDPETALKREVLEEVGLDNVEIFTEDKSFLDDKELELKFLTTPKFIHRHKINETHDHLAMVFFIKSKTDKLTLDTQKEVSKKCRWFNKKELESNKYNIKEYVKHIALNALDTLRN